MSTPADRDVMNFRKWRKQEADQNRLNPPHHSPIPSNPPEQLSFDFGSEENKVSVEDTIRSLETKFLSQTHKLSSFKQCFEAVKTFAGDFGEFGVYHGNGTRELASLDPNRAAWAFDTFEGMLEADYGGAEDASDPPGKWIPNTSNPTEMFEGIPNVRVVKGRFADTLPSVPVETKFVLVHIDCDWYLSHKQVLNGLADNHLADRAILMFDNPGLPGAKRAIDEWCRDFAGHVTRVQDTRIDWHA